MPSIIYKTSRDLLFHVYGYNNSTVDGCIGKIIVNEPYKKKHLLSDHLFLNGSSFNNNTTCIWLLS